jgi:alpha-D-ribose 1-methylphosphonate 5-triphosphate synthase subunit PhnH
MVRMPSGFRDPVFDSQAAFRAVMRAMSRPGCIVHIGSEIDPPSPLDIASAGVCLSLADFETPIWLAKSLRASSAATDYLRLHTGAAIVSAPSQAVFALVDLRVDALVLSDFAEGLPEYPDRSATVIALCDTIVEDGGIPISGPGLRGTGCFGASPLPADFVAQWRRNRDVFPLGIDLIITSGRSLCCLPRSTYIREAA